MSLMKKGEDKVVTVHALKVYEEVGVQQHSFLTSASEEVSGYFMPCSLYHPPPSPSQQRILVPTDQEAKWDPEPV